MGILNRTPDSFFDQGRVLRLRRLPRQGRAARRRGRRLPRRRRREGRARARRSATEEELERVIPALEALTARFDVPLSVDTWRASVLREALGGRRGRRQRHQRVRRPRLPAGRGRRRRVGRGHPHPHRPARARSRARVRRARRRRGRRLPPRPGRGGRGGRHPPRAGDGRRRPRPRQDRAAVARAAAGPRPPGRPRAGRCSCRRRTSGSSATWSAPTVDDRREASHAAHALGIALGSRILRAHDVRGARRTADVMAAVLAARAEASA